MIYCNVEDCEFRNATEFRSSRYFNADDEDVTEILSGDIINIRPLLTAVDWRSDPRLVMVMRVEDDGWIVPVPIQVNPLLLE